MAIVMIAGTIICAIGTVTLVFVFRAFGGKQPGGSAHFGLMAGLVIFIFAVCGGLLLLSYR
jgi:hypothetical protein